MITFTCFDEAGKIILEQSTMRISPMNRPYDALEESVKEARREMDRRKVTPLFKKAKVSVVGEKWLPNGIFEISLA